MGELSSASIPVVFYTDSVIFGGAEQLLSTLVAGLAEDFEPTVVGVSPAILEVISTHAPRAKTYLLSRVSAPWDLRAITEHVAYVRRLRPRILHAHGSSPWACEYGILAALATPRVRVISVVNAAGPWARWPERAFFRLVAPGISANVAPAARPARDIETMRGLREGSVVVIHNGVEDEPTSAAPRPTTGPLVGWTGRLAHEKGVDVFLTALAELPGVTALVVGDGPERPALEALAADLDIEKRVIFTGWQEAPRRFLHGLDLFVMPSRIEAFGLAAAEAMLAEVPVVGSDVGGLNELIIPGRTGILVPPDEPHELASAIAPLLADEAERRRLGREARQLVLDRFSASAMARRYEDLYRRVLAA